MAALAILLAVHARTHSFADAGVVVGVFGGTGAAVTPILGRLVDRVGQVAVLAVCGLVQAGGFVALALGSRYDASYPELVIAATVAGGSLPPLASCMRALWPVLVREPRLREAAYALDAVSQELNWALGPLLVGALVAFASASIALLVCAGATVAGIALFVTAPTPRSLPPGRRPASRAGALASPRLRALLVCIALASIGSGICQVGIPAIGVQAGSPASASVLLGLWSVGSIVGALAFGSVRWSVPAVARYVLLYVLMACATLPLIWSGSIPSGLVSALVAGLPLAALIGCQNNLVSEAAPQGTITEAFAWNQAAAFGALAAGSAAGGWLINQYGLGVAFAVAALCPAVAAAAAAAMVRR